MKKFIRITTFFIILAAATGCITPNKSINNRGFQTNGELRSTQQSWTMALIPDIQTYVKFERNIDKYLTMMKWLKENQDTVNIQLTLFVGDLVEQNDRKTPHESNGDRISADQWATVKEGIDYIWNEMPVIVCAGNHDLGIDNAENRTSHIDKYLKPTKTAFLNPADGRVLREMWDDPVNGQTLQNAFYRWKSPLGQDFHILSLEFAPRKEALEWGKKLISDMPEESNGILLTHSYLSSMMLGSKPLLPENYPIKSDSTSGIQLWKEFIENGNKINMIFCGHVADNEYDVGQIGFRQDLNSNGKVVSQMMFNAQRYEGWNGNGGNGWLRLLEFLPEEETVIVRTFSPWLLEQEGPDKAFRTNEFDTFSFKY